MVARCLAPAILTIALAASPALAWEMHGEKSLFLHGRDGQAVMIGKVTFVPRGQQVGFTLQMDHTRLKDYFLSMKEFKCVESPGEIQCHVPYPHPNPATVSASDLSWLEHSLLFLHKSPQDFGARFWNGLYYRMRLTDRGIVGEPQAVDLDFIAAPPVNPSLPPYGPGERYEIDPNVRWFGRLTIE